MGSFDVGCGLSNLTIHCGDEAGFLILDKIRSNYGDNPSSGKSFLSSGGYLPFLPPVFGVYDDYGRLRNIRASTTTKVLEKLFDRQVEVVMDCLGGTGGIYDSYGEIYKSYMLPECRAAFQRETPVEDALVALGFTKDHNVNGDESFVYDAFEIVPNAQRSTWTISGKETGREFAKVRSGYNATEDLLEAFGIHTGAYPGFSPNDYDRIRLLNRLGGMYFLEEVFVKMDKFSSAEHYMNNFHKRGMARREKELAEFFEYLKTQKDNKFPFSGYLAFTEDLSRDVSLPMNHWRLLEAYESNGHELLSIVRIQRIADSVNRVLAPTYCGEQMGNDRASLMLNHIEKQILDVRKKEYEYEVEDDVEEGYWNLGVEA